MKKVSSFFQLVYERPLRRFLVALLLALALFFGALCVATPTFYDNDDTNIASALAGDLSGTPYPAHPFLNPILSVAVSFFYRVLPAIPWWYVFQCAAILFSLAVIGSCILELSYQKKLPLIVSLLLYGVLAGGLMLYPLFLATFTLTSACLGAAAVGLLLTDLGALSKKRRRWRFAASLWLLILCFLFRNSSGYSVLCFYLGALVYQGARILKLRQGRPAFLRLSAFGLISLALCFVLVLVNGWGQSHYNAEEFPAFEEARGRYLDYPVDSYSDNPALYASVGWDQELYAMVKQWFYMDERVTAATLDTLIEGSASSRQSLSEALAAFREFLSPRPLAIYQGAIPVLLLLSGLFLYRRHRENGLPLLFGCFMLLGGAALTLFLLLSGRIVLRAYQLILIPTGASVLLLTLNALPEPALFSKSGRISRLGFLFPAALALATLFFSYKAVRTTLSYDTAPILSKSQALMQYVLEHNENVYIRDTHVANNVDALTVYPEKKPTNLLDWGGTAAYTGAREAQLDFYGLRPYTAEVFFRENVYLISDPDSRDYKSFSAYLRKEFGAALVRTDTVADGVEVFQAILQNGEEPS